MLVLVGNPTLESSTTSPIKRPTDNQIIILVIEMVNTPKPRAMFKINKRACKQKYENIWLTLYFPVVYQKVILAHKCLQLPSLQTA